MAAQTPNAVEDVSASTAPAPPHEGEAEPVSRLDASTIALHADDKLPGLTDVSPPVHMSTTFKYASNPDDLVPSREWTDGPGEHNYIYSRAFSPTPTRLEAILEPLIKAPTISYASGLSAIHALYVLLHPKRVAFTAGYHGCIGVLALHTRMHGLEVLPLDCPAEALHAGDVVHLETPVNPTGESVDIAAMARKAHSRGAYLLVDSTFAPPPLQEPFALGADVVMHSGTKYFGGHSDLLLGTLSTRRKDWALQLRIDRIHLGSGPGGLESWLANRSLRTLAVRVERQSRNATRLAGWLETERTKVEDGKPSIVGEVVVRVMHSSLQNQEEWLKKQMPNGFGAVFAIYLRSEALARRLPSKLELWKHATSLGGVESLIEWRAMSDDTVDTRLLRLSLGLESWEDLRDDLVNGFNILLEEEKRQEQDVGTVEGPHEARTILEGKEIDTLGSLHEAGTILKP